MLKVSQQDRDAIRNASLSEQTDIEIVRHYVQLCSDCDAAGKIIDIEENSLYLTIVHGATQRLQKLWECPLQECYALVAQKYGISL